MGTRPQAADADLLFDVASVSTPGRRAGAWADALCEHYYPLELATRPGNFSVGRMYIRDIAALRVGTLECDPMEVRLRPEHVRKQVDEFYMIPLTGRSPLTLTQFGRAGDLRPGAKPPDWHEWSGIPDPANPSRPQTVGSMNSFRTDPSEEPPRLIEDEDSQTTWLEDDGSGRFPSIETIGS